jgi:hypothetical protein
MNDKDRVNEHEKLVDKLEAENKTLKEKTQLMLTGGDQLKLEGEEWTCKGCDGVLRISDTINWRKYPRKK